MKFIIGKVRFLLPLVLVVTLAGCVWNQQLNADQVGVVTHGGALDEHCQTSGLVNSGGWWDGLAEVNVGGISVDVSDASVATADTQLVGVDASIQIQRSAKCEDIHNLLTNWPTLTDDKALSSIISSNAAQAIKVGVRNFTVPQLLSDRTGLAISVTTDLQAVAAKFSVNVINVSIKNVAFDPAYQDILNKKALVQANIDLALRQQDQVKAEQQTARITQEQRAETLKAQLLAEQAQTAVQVEIANRAGEVIAAQNRVFLDNPAAFELARLDKLQNIVGKGTVWFVPAGTNLSLLLNNTGAPIVPVPTTSTVPSSSNLITSTAVVTP